MESSDPSAEAEYANSIAQGVYDESVALMDKITNQAKENADNEEADAHKIKYENEEAFNPVEAMKMLSLKTDPLSMAEIEDKLMNGEVVPGIYKIDDKVEDVKEKSESKLKAISRPWLRPDSQTKHDVKEEHSSEVQVQDKSTTSHEHTTNGECCSTQPDLNTEEAKCSESPSPNIKESVSE